MMLGRTDSRMRMVAVLLVFAVFATATGIRLGYWQVVAADELTAQVLEATASVDITPTLRADIVDRDGELLAKTASYDSLDAHPDLIDPADREAIVGTLDALLGLGSGERERILAHLARGDDGDQFETLRPRLSLQEGELIAAAIDDGLLPGITLTPKDARHYPRPGGEPGTTLAAPILGYVRADGRGGEGIEAYYDERLTVVDPGSLDLASIDGIPLGLDGLDPEPLRLTLDAGLQRQVEKELATARQVNQARSASAVVMDPRSGAILAVASVPGYDANDYATVATEDMSRLRNTVFSDQYEPGSVMKIFTAAAAIDQGKVTPNSVIQDQVNLDFWKHTVHNADKKSMGRLKVKDVIAYSRNVATAKIARMLAPQSTQVAAQRLFDFWAKVGMTRATGADVSHEASGSWADPGEKLWAPVDLANRAFGQGVSVTLPQLARGFATLVNGGYLVQPHLVDRGDAPVERTRVLKAKVARQAQEILVNVTGAVPWYAQGSLIPGYLIGGKTGTAQIWDPAKGDWKKRRFNHSFVGFVGGKRPEVLIAVRIEEPKPIWVKQGSIPLHIESYELFQNIARAAITHLDIRKSRDPEAGRPIIGTKAAQVLDPERNRTAIREARRDRKRQEREERAIAGTVASGADEVTTPKGGRPGLAGGDSGSGSSRGASP